MKYEPMPKKYKFIRHDRIIYYKTLVKDIYTRLNGTMLSNRKFETIKKIGNPYTFPCSLLTLGACLF
jgi:hypothetical protein